MLLSVRQWMGRVMSEQVNILPQCHPLKAEWAIYHGVPNMTSSVPANGKWCFLRWPNLRPAFWCHSGYRPIKSHALLSKNIGSYFCCPEHPMDAWIVSKACIHHCENALVWRRQKFRYFQITINRVSHAQTAWSRNVNDSILFKCDSVLY